MIEYIKLLTTNKTRWEDLTEGEQKGFVPFSFNMFLSKNEDYIEIVNEIQSKGLSPEQLYNVYYHLLPKKYINIKFPKKPKLDIPKELITIIKSYYRESEANAIEYIDVLQYNDLENILIKTGLDKKEIKKLLKWKKS